MRRSDGPLEGCIWVPVFAGNTAVGEPPPTVPETYEFNRASLSGLRIV